jgi:hypothetical protein
MRFNFFCLQERAPFKWLSSLKDEEHRLYSMNDTMTVNNNLKGGIVYLKETFKYLPRRTEEHHKNLLGQLALGPD